MERTWDEWDVAVIRADVAVGKSKIAECLSAWIQYLKQTSVITIPNNNLLTQYIDSTRGIDSIRNQTMYTCVSDPRITCGRRKQIAGTCCKPPPGGNTYSRGACPYVRDLRRLRSTKRLVATAHALLAHGVRKDVLIADEAHTLINFVQDLNAVHIWQPKYRWPLNPSNQIPALLKWVQSIPRRDDKQDLLLETLCSSRPRYTLDMSPKEYYGAETNCITLVPIDTSRLSNPLLAGVQKVILMSATINDLDVHQLGLAGRRVKYFELPSPIPPEQRPILVHPVADMRFAGRGAAYEEMARWIDQELLPAHTGERGLIHATYEFAEYLRAHTNSDRLIFHNHEDKPRVLANYLSTPGDDRVLVGSGMYEGLDLAGDLARFQVITQIPRRSLEDPGIRWLAENNPTAYDWLTIRDLVQATGRVCRSETDYGLTIIADSSYIGRESTSALLPDSFIEAHL